MTDTAHRAQSGSNVAHRGRGELSGSLEHHVRAREPSREQAGACIHGCMCPSQGLACADQRCSPLEPTTSRPSSVAMGWKRRSFAASALESSALPSSLALWPQLAVETDPHADGGGRRGNQAKKPYALYGPPLSPPASTVSFFWATTISGGRVLPLQPNRPLHLGCARCLPCQVGFHRGCNVRDFRGQCCCQQARRTS